VELSWGRSSQSSIDGDYMAGLLYFPSECSGKLIDDKRGWIPAIFIKTADIDPLSGAGALGFIETRYDACAKSGAGLRWLTP